MSTLKADTVTTKSDNTDLTITGGGTGVPNLETGFKVGGTAGVPVSELRAGTDGELITWDASGNPATVSVGTATHVLTSNGAGAAPTFQAAGGGATAVLARATFTDTSSGVSFTAFDSSTYDAYQFIFYITDTSTTDIRIYVQTSTDGGSSYDSGSSDYLYRVAEAGGDTNSSWSAMTIQPNHRSTGVSTEPICFTAFLVRPDTADKTVLFWAGGMYATGLTLALSNMIGAGSRDTAADVDGIKFYPSTGTVSGSYQAIGWKRS